MKRDILVGTNGFSGTWPGIEYAAWLGDIMHIPVTLVGIIDKRERPNIDEEMHPLEDIFGHALTLFKEKQLEFHLEMREGRVEDVIPQAVKEKNYLTVLTPFGRPPLRRLFQRRSFRQLIAEIEKPILYVPTALIPPTNMLVCLGGLGYGLTTESLGLQIAAQIKIPVTLLHIVPPIDLDYPEARIVRENLDQLPETDSLLGRTLRKGLDNAQNSGLETSLKIRQGNIIEEILAEVRDGDYDLVCMGSPYSAHSLRKLYAPDVTAEIAEAIQCPILTARYQSRDNRRKSFES